MRSVKSLLGVVLVCLVVACGGGNEAGPPALARAGSATVGAAGGRVDAVLADGSSVTLAVPPNAVDAPATFSIAPAAAPSGTLGGFTLTGPQQHFAQPLTLSVRLPASATIDADTILLLDTGARRIPLSRTIDVASRTVSVELSSFGTATSVPVAAAASTATSARARIQATSISTATLQVLLAGDPFALRVNLLDLVVRDLQGDGSVQNATNVQLAMASLLGLAQANTEPRIRADIAAWRTVVCTQQQHFVSALNTFAGVDAPTFTQRVFDVLTWDRFAQDLNELVAKVTGPAEAGCPNLTPDFAQPVRDMLPTFLANVATALDNLDPAVEFTQLLTVRIPELLKLEVVLQQTDMAQSVLNLIGDQTVRLRVAAYAQCRADRNQARQRSLLVKEVGDVAFEPASPFSAADLREDIEFCGLTLHWKVTDAQGAVMQQGDVGGVSAGVTIKAATLRLAGAAKISLTGPAAALVCPVSSQNNEQLLFTAGPAGGTLVQVAQLSPSNANGYLEVSALDLDVATLRGQGAQRLVVNRQGGTCNGDFPTLGTHPTLVTFTLDASSLAVATTSLPSATVGTAYSTTLAATGGTAPLTWSATGLPAGLALNAQTGEISGTPTGAGTATVAIIVTDAASASALANLSLTVSPQQSVPSVAGTYAGTHIDNTTGTSRPATVSVAQSGNLVLIGRVLCELAPGGGLNYLGNSSGAFEVDPSIPVTQSFTGQFLGTGLTFRIVDLIPGTDGSRDDDSFFLTRQ